MPSRTDMKALVLLVVIYGVAIGPMRAKAEQSNETYSEESVLSEASSFLGEGAEGIGDVIEKLFKDLGKPNAYIEGQEARGALGIGARCGNRTLFLKCGGQTEVHWVCLLGSRRVRTHRRSLFWSIHLPSVEALFQRFPAWDRSFYFVGGVSANYHQVDDTILAPIRLGAGLLAGVNIGYMKYTHSKTWNPF